MRSTYDIACPKFGATAGLPCRTLQTRRITDTHLARLNAYYAPKRGATA